MGRAVIRRVRSLSRPHGWLAALLVALAMQALVPAGWMPAADGRGLVMCNGASPAPTAAEIARLSSDGVPYEIAAARAAIDREAHGGAPAPDGSDHPCAFAGCAPALTSPIATAPLAPRPAAVQPSALVREVAVGRGLSAPPPLATGPPVTT
jgi:hypothetical protein